MGDKHQDSFAALLQQANIKQQLQETFIKQLAELKILTYIQEYS